MIDDDRDIRDSVADLLGDEGYEVLTASDGGDAQRVLARRRPELILLDLMMPGMNGWTFRAWQVEQAELAAIPVVVLSAHPVRASELEVLRAVYLPKPVLGEKLLAVIRQQIERCAAGGPPGRQDPPGPPEKGLP